MIQMKIQIIKKSIKYIQKVAVSTEEGINKVVLHVDNKYQVYPQMFKEDWGVQYEVKKLASSTQKL